VSLEGDLQEPEVRGQEDDSGDIIVLASDEEVCSQTPLRQKLIRQSFPVKIVVSVGK
jgi:hypothetical protein